MTKLESVRDATDADARRADAKVKRLEIEMRNAGAPSPEKTTERDSLMAEASRQAQKLAEADRALAEAQSKS